MRKSAVACLAALLISPAGCAGDGTAACTPVVADGWIRPGPPSMPMRAGFGRIVNDCAAPLAITGASSPAFADVSLHETTVADGISRMRPVPELQVPADGEAVLAPGGLHLMLAEPQGELARGDTVVVEFVLRDGGTLRGEFAVR